MKLQILSQKLKDVLPESSFSRIYEINFEVKPKLCLEISSECFPDIIISLFYL